ncbi:hypothetical protein B7R22_16650 [Subtercola boreus]|uniref:Uncharacterized protein n=1 Tax=Subtercola boreus TaxID=120213 RepID=A0A3E0VQV4_9MICO|nr:hypothetical protein B7R22_16650 [Subtercola boreus]
MFYLGIFAVVSQGQVYGVVLFLGWTGSTQIKTTSLALIIVCPAVAAYCLGGTAASRIPTRWVRGVVTVVGGGIVFVGGTIAMLFALLFAILTATTNYYTFPSPDGHNIILISEQDHYGEIAEHAWGPVYSVKAKYSPNDWYQPIAKGTFTTAWSPTGFTLTYQVDWDRPGTETITVSTDTSAPEASCEIKPGRSAA